MIITKRLQLSMENEEKGTNKQLTMCQSGPGGIALVTGLAAPSKTGGAVQATKTAPSDRSWTSGWRST